MLQSCKDTEWEWLAKHTKHFWVKDRVPIKRPKKTYDTKRIFGKHGELNQTGCQTVISWLNMKFIFQNNYELINKKKTKISSICNYFGSAKYHPYGQTKQWSTWLAINIWLNGPKSVAFEYSLVMGKRDEVNSSCVCHGGFQCYFLSRLQTLHSKTHSLIMKTRWRFHHHLGNLLKYEDKSVLVMQREISLSNVRRNHS